MPVKYMKWPVSTTIKEDGKKPRIEIVDVAEYPVFERLQEAIEEAGGGEAGEKKVLDRYNTQIRTDALNRVRSQYNKGPSLRELQARAYQSLIMDPATVTQLQELAKSGVAPEVVEQKIQQMAVERAEREKATFESDRLAKIRKFQAENPELLKEAQANAASAGGEEDES